MATLAGAAHTLLGFEIVRAPFDQTIEAELLGAGVSYGDQTSNCSVRSHPRALPEMPDFTGGRARVVTEAIGILKRLDAAVIGGIVGPFTLACQLGGLQETLMAAVRNRETLRPWIEFAVEAGIAYARRQVEAGADAICVEDMSASLDLTSPAIYRDLVLPAHRRLAEGIPVPVILHICGANTRILELLASSGVEALSLESKTDLARAVSLGVCAVIGGIDPVGVLMNGTRERVREAAIDSLAAGVHILAPGCGIPPDVSSENLLEMMRASREWRN
jgi:[methyl-Co(III) methanol-specific corrinoid protein]:coenzyme M methyltransferase